jgi:5-methylcytosine-specific restriction endonuclease McrA
MTESTQKTCSKCGEMKPLDDFSPNRRTPSGRQPSCKACVGLYRAANREKVQAQQAKYKSANREKINARARERSDPEASRSYYLANRDRIREQQKQYRLVNGEAKRAGDAEYRAENRERLRLYHLAYAEANREESRRRATAWMKANPERVAEIQRRRRARKRNATVGAVDLEALWTGFCGICEAPMEWSPRRPDPLSKSIDHIVPLSKGGAHEQSNLQWAHLVCNFRKGDRLDT